MPALPSPGKVVRFDYHFDVGEDLNAKVRRYFGYTGTPPTPTDLAGLAGITHDSFNTNLKGLMFTSYVLTSLELTDLSASTGSVFNDTTPIVGTRTGPPLSADVCMLVSYEIGRRYRGGHARSYWPFLVDSDLSDVQTWKGTTVTAAQADVDADNAAIIAGVWAGGASLGPVNVSFYEGFTNVAGPTGRMHARSTVRLVPLVDPIESLIVRTGIAVQRKRLLRLA